MSVSIPDINEKYVSAQSFTAQFDRLAAVGVEIDKVARQSGISLTRVEQGQAGTLKQKISLLRTLQNQELPKDFYLRPSQAFNISSFGLIGFAMFSSEDLAKSLQIGARYYPVSGSLIGVSIEVDDINQMAYLQLNNIFNLEYSLLQNVLEEVISTFPPLLQTLTGQNIDALCLDLEYPEPDHSSLYEELFGIKPNFNADKTRFGISSKVMALSVVSSNPATAALLEQSCEDMLSKLIGQSSLLKGARKNLLSSIGNLMNRQQLAESLNMTERMLRRRLANENTSYKQLVREVREQVAKDYLNSTGLSIEQIADLLGYTEATNFRRAFLRWTGISPSKYRREQQYG